MTEWGQGLPSQQLFNPALQNHDIRGFLYGTVVPRLKITAVFQRPHHLTSLCDEGLRDRLTRGAAAGKRFINLNHQAGNLLQPGEMRVSQHQRQKLARPGDGAGGLFVDEAFTVQQQFVLLQKKVSQFVQQCPALCADGFRYDGQPLLLRRAAHNNGYALPDHTLQ